ncbi:MAG: hypothetical protein WD069_04600 [Planctomycetales bacterium]
MNWLWNSIAQAIPAAALLAQSPPKQPADYALTPLGWTIMIVSVGCVLSLVIYCLVRVLSLPPIEDEHLKGPLEIDTGDTEDAD